MELKVETKTKKYTNNNEKENKFKNINNHYDNHNETFKENDCYKKQKNKDDSGNDIQIVKLDNNQFHIINQIKEDGYLFRKIYPNNNNNDIIVTKNENNTE